MTKTEKLAKMQELREKAESLVMLYNEGIQNGNPNPTMEKSEIVDGKPTEKKVEVYIKPEIEQVVNEYTSIAREICFEECIATGDAMLEAVKRLTYDTIGFKESKKGEEEIIVAEIVDRSKVIDLLKLHKVAKGIGKDKNWDSIIQKMNLEMTVRQAKRLIGNKGNLTKTLKEIRDSYAMSEIAKSIELGKDPTSNTKLLATLQTIVTAMIGEEYKPTSHDVNYLADLYASKGKTALSVNCANHSYFTRYIMAICHRIVTSEDYEISFKKVSGK